MFNIADMDSAPGKLLALDEIQRILQAHGVDRSIYALRRWCASGRLKAIRVRPNWMSTEAWAMAAIRAGKNTPAAELRAVARPPQASTIKQLLAAEGWLGEATEVSDVR